MSAIFVVFTFAFFIILDVIVRKVETRRVEVQKVARIKEAPKKKRPITEDRGVKQVFHTKKAKAIWNDLTIHARSVIEKAHRGISEKG